MHDNYAVYVKDVVKSYGNNAVLKNLCMTVERGMIYGLLGASGCGKTTLLSSIVGRKSIDSGDIWVLGGKPGDPACGVPGPRVGYMPQDLALVGEFTVKDAVYYFGRIFGMDDSLIAERYKNLHNLLELPPNDRFLKDCSGGQQRRVSFAAALVHKPELLIMDEPTVGVDPVLRDRIWNYLVEITRKENISVIITTHYIEECRQANKIGLMREGRLLAQETPNRLLTLFNTETLEEVFLILSRRQEEGRLEDISAYPTADDQNNSVLPEQVLAGSTMSVATGSTFDVGHGSTDILTKKRLSSTNSVLKGHRMKALLDKNWKQFYRNITGIVFLVIFPILQCCIFLISVGGNIKNVPLGIVNDEAMSSYCANYITNGSVIPDPEGTCHFHNISCRFLKYLDDPMIMKRYYGSLDEAKDSVKHGDVVGALYIPGNYTELTEERLELGRDISDEELDLSFIKVWMDMSNRQVGQTVRYKLYDLYIHYQEDVFNECQYTPGLGKLPVNIDFLYGHQDDAYTVFMIPGAVITIMFFMGAIMTSQIIISDRHDGVWDRSIVAGVTSLEITLTHFALQFGVAIFQSVEIMVIIYGCFRESYDGNMWLMYLITVLQAICGMAYGFWISVVSINHSMANTILTGIYLPMLMLSGMMWPTEGMPYPLAVFSKCLPFTLAIESFRNVSKKGWTIGNLQVFDGIGVTICWTLFFGIVSVYLIKTKR